MPPITIIDPFDTDAREQLYADFKAKILELRSAETIDTVELLELCAALFAFNFNEAIT